MKLTMHPLAWAAAALFLAASPAQATVACSAVALDAKSAGIPLFAAPSETAATLGQVPTGDLLLYPDPALAPNEAEGWAWVRHDPTQEDIWQSGQYGWVRTGNLADCG